MAKEYLIKPKHSVGKKVYIVDRDTYDNKKPKVFVGEVVQIRVILDDKDGLAEPILEYRVKLAESYHDDKNYFDFQLLTKSEAERRYQVFCNELKTFDDIYLKTMLKKAHELINAYKDK